jgi:hypothetical protein
MNEFFKTTDYNDLPVSESQNKALGKNIEFVSGSEFHTNIYDVKVASHKSVKYFQLALFSQNNKRAIRLYVLEGTSPVGGTCLYEYKVLKIKDYSLPDEYFKKFEKELKEQNQNNSGSDTKIMLKYYPVYNFSFTEPPSGDDITQCTSELLN